MHVELYQLHLRNFMKYLEEDGVDVSLSARWEKLQEEIKELGNATTPKEKIEETADCLNVLFSMMDMLGVHDPLHVCWEKLTATRSKYVRAKNGLELLKNSS